VQEQCSWPLGTRFPVSGCKNTRVDSARGKRRLKRSGRTCFQAEIIK